MRRSIAALLGLSLVVAACGPGSGESGVTPFAVVASANGTIGLGTQRVMFALVDLQTDEFLASPDRNAVVTLRDENGAPIDTYDMEFIWTVPESRGLYVAYMDFSEPGTYQATIETEGMAEAGPVGIVVFEDPLVAQPGDNAVPSVTRTIVDYPDLAVISSDTDPDPEMYQKSIDQAVGNGTPAVITFATPVWCASQTCGPLLDQVKVLRPDYPGVDFLHVEVYEDIQVASLEDLETIAAVEEWGLPSEPWVFIVDSNGVVTASFEGAASDSELAIAIGAVAS